MNAISALLLSLALLFPVISPAQGDRTIHVSGQAEIRVVPDEAVLVVGIETQDLEMDAAKSENDAINGRIMSALDDLDIEPEDIHTDHLDAEPRWRYRDGERIFEGYFMRRSIAVTIKDTGNVEAVLSGCLRAGATHVHDLSFRTADLRKHRDEARRLAIRAAKEKAEDLTSELGVAVGFPRNISEGRFNIYSPYYSGSGWGRGGGGSGFMMQNVIQESGSGGGAEAGGFALGRITITAEVSVSFDIVAPEAAAE